MTNVQCALLVIGVLVFAYGWLVSCDCSHEYTDMLYE
jgi:hypothetical protein